MNKIHVLRDAIEPPPLKIQPSGMAQGTICAMTGEQIALGYPLSKVISVATADITDTFRYPSEFVGEAVGRLFKFRQLRGNMVAANGVLSRPMISRESALAQNRPCWHDLIMSLDRGTQTVAIVTDESKRRLWHLAPLSEVGEAWRVYLHGSPFAGATPLSRTVMVSINRVRECLTLITSALDLGFTASQIGRGILDAKIVETIGIKESIQLEKEIRDWRGSDIFLLAITVARRTAEGREEQQADSRPEDDSTNEQEKEISPCQLTLF